MNIAIISAHFPPRKGGVSDYTEKLAHQFIQDNNTVIVFSNEANPTSFTSLQHEKIETFPQWIKNNSPEFILVQYTPLMYAPKRYGIGLQLIRILRKIPKKIPLYGMIHESHYPLQFSRKGIVIGIPHFLQFIILTSIFTRCFFSNIAICNKWKRILPWKRNRFDTLPVFSNITPSQAERDESAKLQLLYFGGSHPTNRIDFVLEAYKQISKSCPTTLTSIGADLSKNEASILCYKDLSEAEVSRHFIQSDLILAPFSDGATTRRGTLMAAFAHAKCVLTTQGPLTRDDVPWETIACLSNNNKESFVTCAKELAQNKSKRDQLGKNAKEYYSRHFATEHTTKKLLSYYCP